MIELGIVVGIGLLVFFFRANWRWRMRVLSNPGIVDVMIFIFVTLIHWGTFSGLMVAAVAALFCSITLSGLRWYFGYVKDRTYVQGVVNVEDKL
jgi:hypothetical protein